MKLFSRFVIVLVLLQFSTHGFAQGSLTPPGPPGPGMRTLDQIQPHIPISSLPYGNDVGPIGSATNSISP